MNLAEDIQNSTESTTTVVNLNSTILTATTALPVNNHNSTEEEGEEKMTTTVIKITDNSTEIDESELERVNQRIQRQTMACASSPCGSYGVCYDVPFPAPLPAGFYCVCNEGFTGTQCEKGLFILSSLAYENLCIFVCL